MSALANAMIEVAKISAAAKSAENVDGGKMQRIGALLEQQAESFQQQTLLNMKLLEALEKLSSK